MKIDSGRIALLVGLLTVAIALYGCGSTSGDDGGVSTDGGGSADGGGDAGGGGGGLTCADYCASIIGACTGDNQQYADSDHCLNACAAFPAGALADTSGDTLGCRIYHAGVAAQSADNAAVHCVHAGPGGAGVCGNNCDGYCDMELKYCTGAAALYADRAACLAACGAVADTIKYSVAVESGVSVACMLFHAEELAPMMEDHCNHPVEECK
jgi:hypothetical protein